MNVTVPIDPYTGESLVAVNGQAWKPVIEKKQSQNSHSNELVMTAIRIVWLVLTVMPLAANRLLKGIWTIVSFKPLTQAQYIEAARKRESRKVEEMRNLDEKSEPQQKADAPNVEASSPYESDHYLIATTHVDLETHGGTKLRLSFYADQRVVRRVGVPRMNLRGRASAQYRPVRPLTRDDFGPDRPFCVETAILLTKQDVANGLLRDMLAIGTIPNRELPTTEASAKQEPTSLVIEEPTELPASKFTKSATGQVVRMEHVTKRFGDKAPYETFEVVVRKANTEEVEFNGKQLEEKAAAGIFKLGDFVAIGQTKITLEKKGKSGRAFNTSSNAFEIKVIKSAI